MKDSFQLRGFSGRWVRALQVLTIFFPLVTQAQIPRLTPTPTRAIIQPTPTPLIIKPTPTATPILIRPTSTPIIVNPFDLRVSQVVLDTTQIVHSIPSHDRVQGRFWLETANSSKIQFDLRIEYTLLDSDQNPVKQWTESRHAVALHPAGEGINELAFSLPITPADELLLKSHFIRTAVRVLDEKSKLPVEELNLSNNTADSNTHFILHTSGIVLFDAIQTQLAQLRLYTPNPLMISGEATLNGTIPLTFNQILVQRNANLDLKVIDGSVPFALPSPHRPSAGPWEYTHDGAALTPEGAFAFLRVILPPGVSYRPKVSNNLLFTESPMPIMIQELDQDLNVAAQEMTSSAAFIWRGEGLPFEIETQGFVFRPDGKFTLLQPRIVYQFAFPTAPAAGNTPRPSNDGYFQAAATVEEPITITPGGINARLRLAPGQYQSSFPRPFEVSHNGGEIVIKNGRIHAAESALRDVAARGKVQTNGCGAGESVLSVDIPGAAGIAPDGSVLADGSLKIPWQPAFNTYQFDAVTHAAWYQPGFHLPESQVTGGGTQIAAYLLAARDRKSDALAGSGALSLAEGPGLFAGINLMPEAFEALPFTAGIGGDRVEFRATVHTKLYVRQAGYSGVVHAQGGENGLELYPDPDCGNRGYATRLTSFGQAYLDNYSEGLDSVTEGVVNLPWPAAFDVPFEDMTLNACGDLTEGRVPPGAQAEERILSYWNAPFRLLTLAFLDRAEHAPPGNKTLWLTTMNKIPHYQDTVYMQVNLCPMGQVRDSFSDHPAQSEYDGYKAAIETIYFSYYDGNPVLPNGFYNLIGDMVVSFFDPPKIHALVRGAVGRIADGSPWAEHVRPDTARRGFPDGFQAQNSDIAGLIETYVAQHPIHVRKLFANLIPLDYELVYHPSRKVFQSPAPKQQDLIVLDIVSAVENLNPRLAEISFGIEAGGLPELNLSSLGESFTSGISNTFLGPVRDRLEAAAQTLTGDITMAVREPMRNYIQPRVAAFLNDVQPYWAQLDSSQAAAFIDSATFADVLDGLLAEIHLPSYLHLNTNPVAAKVQELLDHLNAVNAALHFKPSTLAEDLGPLVQALLDLAFLYAQIAGGIYVQDIIAPIEQPLQEIIHFLDAEVLPRLEEAQQRFSLEGANSFLLSHFPGAQIAQAETEIKDMLRQVLRQWAASHPARLQNLQAEEITGYILVALLNSALFRQFNSVLTDTLFPIKDALLDQAQGVLDLINHEIKTFIKEKTDFVDGAYSQIKNALGFEGASMKGYAVISGNRMDKLHIDGEFTMKSPEEITYSAYLDLTRYQASNSGTACAGVLDENESMDVRIGAKNTVLDWAGADLTADLIELKLMISRGRLVNVGGAINTSGTLGFESFAIEGPDFGLAIGAVENYLYAGCSVFFETYRLSGGIFLGRSCTLEPLQVIDPRAAERLTIPSMSGVYLGVEGTFPILDYGCALRVGAEASLAMWYFTEGPTYGGRLEAGVYGRVACVISAKGKLELNAGKNNGTYYFDGRAWAAGGIGWCEPSQWTTPQKALKDSWCFACVAIFDLFFDEGWSADYETDCG